MNAFLKLKVRNQLITFLPFLVDWIDCWDVLRALHAWKKKGLILPLPGRIKRSIIKARAEQARAHILVETGTFRGDTPWYFRRDFAQIHSVEVEPTLAAIAQVRFRHQPHVEIHVGDSADLLGRLCPMLDRPVIFWLDGHYSGGITGRGQKECPIWEELDAIFTGMRVPFIILIDDARCFGTDIQYPTLDELRVYLLDRRPDYSCIVENDIITLVSKQCSS